MNRLLLKAIVDLAAFLELSGGDIIRPEAATEQLGILFSTLEELTDKERNEFVGFVQELIEAQHGKVTAEPQIRFLTEFIENLAEEE